MADANNRDVLNSGNEFDVTPLGYAEFQWTFNSAGSDDEHGFELDQVGFGFAGEANNFSFMVDGAFMDETTFELQNAWVNTGILEFADFRAGQFRPNVSFENGIHNGHTLTLDRSIVNSTFASDFSQGVEASFGVGGFDVSAFVINGFDETSWDASTSDSEYGFGGRVVFTALGDAEAESHVLVGGSVYVDDDITTFIADTDSSFGMVGLDAAAVWADVDGVDGDVWAVSATPSFDLTELFTAYGRAEYGEMDDSTLSVVNAGVSVNLVGSAVRWISEVGYTLDDLGGSWDTMNTGWGGMSVDSGEYVFSSGIRVVF